MNFCLYILSLETSTLVQTIAAMAFLDLFVVASMPVLKVLLLTALGAFLASGSMDVLGENARKQLNNIVFFVFNPALVSINLAKTVTAQGVVWLWFMPFNILGTFIIGSALGWMLIKITRAPHHLRGLILGCCAAGNMGHLPIIIVPAICKERGSPFADPDMCYSYGMAYASLSMAIGSIYLWSYVYNIVRVSSGQTDKEVERFTETTSKSLESNYTEALLSCEDSSVSAKHVPQSITSSNKSERIAKVPDFDKIRQYFSIIQRKLNLKALFAPSTTGALVGFIIGIIPKLRHLLIGDNAPLRVVRDSASMLGDAAIPITTLIVGGNLLKGLKGQGIGLSIVAGVIAVRYILLPILGIVIVRSAVRFNLVHSDPLYQFILLLQYALPPAINIGTITQLFKAGESECSVILLWTYALASIALTLWSTLFMWLVS